MIDVVNDFRRRQRSSDAQAHDETVLGNRAVRMCHRLQNRGCFRFAHHDVNISPVAFATALPCVVVGPGSGRAMLGSTLVGPPSASEMCDGAQTFQHLLRNGAVYCRALDRTILGSREIAIFRPIRLLTTRARRLGFTRAATIFARKHVPAFAPAGFVPSSLGPR